MLRQQHINKTLRRWLLMVVMMLAALTGAWAQTTPHDVNGNLVVFDGETPYWVRNAQGERMNLSTRSTPETSKGDGGWRNTKVRIHTADFADLSQVFYFTKDGDNKMYMFTKEDNVNRTYIKSTGNWNMTVETVDGDAALDVSKGYVKSITDVANPHTNPHNVLIVISKDAAGNVAGNDGRLIANRGYEDNLFVFDDGASAKDFFSQWTIIPYNPRQYLGEEIANVDALLSGATVGTDYTQIQAKDDNSDDVNDYIAALQGVRNTSNTTYEDGSATTAELQTVWSNLIAAKETFLNTAYNDIPNGSTFTIQSINGAWLDPSITQNDQQAQAISGSEPGQLFTITKSGSVYYIKNPNNLYLTLNQNKYANDNQMQLCFAKWTNSTSDANRAVQFRHIDNTHVGIWFNSNGKGNYGSSPNNIDMTNKAFLHFDYATGSSPYKLRAETMEGLDHVSKLNPTAVWTLVPPHVVTPEINIDYDAVTATITTATPDAAIYYTFTTDGTEPADPTDALSAYDGSAIALTPGMKIKAIAYKDGLRPSEMASATYTMPTVATPVVKVSTKGRVTITCETEGATFRYTSTINGTEPADPTIDSPTITSGTVIDDATVGQTVWVKVIATKTNYNNSEVASASKVIKKADPGYYAIHQSGKGYLRVSGANVSLNNDGSIHFVDLFGDAGNSFWIQTEDGYLQNGYYYLNVANNQTLYLSVHPVTEWDLEEINTNGHGNMSIMYNGKYLCNDGTNITLTSDAEAAHYNACPITITERSWSEPTNNDLTVQSPQIVTYLRHYYTQYFDYEFYDDGGTRKAESNTHRNVYALQTYASGGDGKGTTWNITTDGVIHNMQASGNVVVTATYDMTPADPLVGHQDAVQKSFKLTIEPSKFTPDASKTYLFFNIQNGDYRFLNDAGSGDYAGPGVNKSQLTDPANGAISWKIERDTEGFYSFKNVSTGKYLCFDINRYVDGTTDYGTLLMGATSVPDDANKNKYRFRLFKTGNDGTFGDAWFIIPYDHQFVVYKNDGVANDILSSLNVYKDYSTKVVSLWKPSDSRWRFYAYDVVHRLRTDWTIAGPNEATEAGTYNFETAVGYCKIIKDAPQNNQELEIKDSWTTASPTVTYTWTYTPDVADGTSGNVHTETPSWVSNKSRFSINFTTLNSSTAGTVQLTATTDAGHGNLSQTKSVAFNINMAATEPVSFTTITTLSQIAEKTGNYKLTVDNPTGTPGVTNFQGYLDGDGHTISGLSAPLFTTLSGNAVVRNLNLSGVSISGSGNTGAIAGEATGNARIYNVGILGGTVSGSGYTGGIVGLLDGMARVINCFSYANITGGTTVGGIVGYNNYASTSVDLRTMVMNCIFYGDITGGNSKSPVYGGEKISNDNTDNAHALNTFNYYAYDAPYSLAGNIDAYNCALGAEKRFLNRFEFYRNILNSNRELALWYVTGTTNASDASSKMYKWVLETANKTINGTTHPYPILKKQGTYPSIINFDAEHAPDMTPGNEETDRNKGKKIDELNVSISQGDNAPDGAAIKEGKTSFTLNVTDKDFDNFNFNYRKVQLPYYNEVGTGNYTDNKVVTGWEVTVSGGTTNFTTATYDAPDYNFADPKCTGKDDYATSGRIFAQGGYFNVPDGVESISIKPHWGKAIYLSDPYYDEVYNKSYSKADVTIMGKRFENDHTYPIKGSSQKVYTTIGNARNQLDNTTGLTVYDQAIVLVGNYHHFSGGDAIFGNDQTKPYTVMSADFNNDNEPDYSFFFQSTDRVDCAPIRFDFLNFPGLGMAQKVSNSSAPQMPNQGILRIRGWFEVTTTCIVRFTEFEYDYLANKQLAPLILLGGVFEQITANNTADNATVENTRYIHLGDNVWFKMFNNGTHADKKNKTKHVPISVTGGDYDKFYLSGMFKPDANIYTDNAECYINGGRFGELASGGMEQIDGDVTFLIDNADITNFYGGGINPANPVTGSISVTINDSHVGTYCGGPKFGNMMNEKEVTTIAARTTFNTFFGAGYGGSAFNRVRTQNESKQADYPWNTWSDDYKREYNAGNSGISTSYESEFFAWAGGGNTQNVGRFYVNYASLSLATTHDVHSTLTGCFINSNFYGGGSLGSVEGDVTSTLTNCIVNGNVFGAGFSASVPTVDVFPKQSFVSPPSYNSNVGIYNDPVYPTPVPYTWSKKGSNSSPFTEDDEGNWIYTDKNLNDLGKVTGTVTLNIDGSTTVAGDVYGGGESSAVNGSTEVNIK